MIEKTYFVSGIDTNIGKSYATGYIAKQWMSEEEKVITQKLIQTGNTDYSEDIDLHRKIMGIENTPFDIDKTTMPEIFSYPCSPLLASKLDNREVDFNKIKSASKILEENFDKVIIEGAGGLMVPLLEDYFIIDYVRDMNYPLIFVTCGRLGSVSQTMLNLKLIKSYNIKLHTLIYNTAFDSDELISNDSFEFIQRQTSKLFKNVKIIKLPRISFFK